MAYTSDSGSTAIVTGSGGSVQYGGVRGNADARGADTVGYHAIDTPTNSGSNKSNTVLAATAAGLAAGLPTIGATGTGGAGGGGGYSGGYSGGGGGGGGKSAADYAAEIASDPDSAAKLTAPNAADNAKALMDAAGKGFNVDGNEQIGRIDHIDTSYMKSLVDQLTEQQRQQVQQDYDYAMSTGTRDLQRTQENAQEGFRNQQNQITRDEQRALDNQVLYNEARGDRGGVGQAQYNAIQNTAATNRQTVRNEQQKLGTDINRQIADLRAQGNFEKADKLLEISQNYLSQLYDLEQYALSTNLSIDEFNLQVDEWEKEFNLNLRQFLTDAELNIAQATGAFSNGNLTQAAWAQQQQQLAAIAQALMDKGITPTSEQLQALGMTTAQGGQYLKKVKG